MLKLFFSGLIMGIGAIMPGVSGGSFAFILGIYDRLLEAVGNFFTCTTKKRKEYFLFLLQVGLGVLLGTLVFTKIIEFLYINYKEPTNFLFIGLIVASLPTILKENEGKTNKIGILSLVVGIIIMIFLMQFKEPSDNLNVLVDQTFSKVYYFKLLFCGFITGVALIIPGLSGTVLLMLMGEYYNVVSYISNFNIVPIIVIGIGCSIGLVIFSKIINFLFLKYKNITINCILGLITASIVGIWPGFSKENAIINIVCFVIGVLIMYFGEKIGKSKD